jgi:hypothetical protein
MTIRSSLHLRPASTPHDLIGRRTQNSERHEVTFGVAGGASPWGARPADLVSIALPNGRTRTLRVLDVRHGERSAGTTPGEGVVRAA